MRKLLILLAVLIATPAFALTVELIDNGDGTVDVNYTATGDANQPRAFALTVSVTGDAVITAVAPAMTGESEVGNKGFGIFPGTIDINGVTGVVNGYGSPVAPATDPGAGSTGIGTASVVIELGSLYVAEANAPLEAATLCTLTIDCNGSTNVEVSAVEEDAYRGGVVLEDTSAATLPAVTPITICAGAGPCFPGSPGDAAYDEWVSVGEPECWCVSEQPRQCHGDADGISEGKGNYWTSFNDLAVLKSAWNKNYATIEGLTAGVPATSLICADFDHVAEGKGLYRVSFNDLAILKANWNQANLPDPNCVN